MPEEYNRKDLLTTSGVEAKKSLNSDKKTDFSVPLDMPEVDSLKIVIITDNYYDSLASDTQNVKRYRTTPGKSIHAEHGVSFYIETKIDGITCGMMFDFGVDPAGMINNMELLEIDLSRTKAFGLSHGHFDHWGGLLKILKHNKLKIRRNTPLYTGKEAFFRRFSIRPSESEPTDIGRLNKREIEELGILNIIEVNEPIEIFRGLYLTGNIERVTSYENGAPNLLVKRGDELERDFFEGEQAVICNVKDRGLVVITGCAHVGIINTVLYSQKITGRKIHAVIGGFHLVNATSETIDGTLADMKRICPDHIVPAHCTGFYATSLFAKEMHEQFIMSTAGAEYLFSSLL